MINHKLKELNMPDELQQRVNVFNVPGGWDLKDKNVVEYKGLLKERLYQNQDGKCAYCGLPLETRNPEIDHIAPKGGPKRTKYPECSFLPVNLVYSCHNCNSPECKGQIDTVRSKNGSNNYYKWSFAIVHPYLDDPRDFFEISDDNNILVLPKRDIDKEHSQKAKYTIKLFKLDSEQKLTEQAKELYFKSNPQDINDLIKKISTYRMR